MYEVKIANDYEIKIRDIGNIDVDERTWTEPGYRCCLYAKKVWKDNIGDFPPMTGELENRLIMLIGTEGVMKLHIKL